MVLRVFRRAYPSGLMQGEIRSRTYFKLRGYPLADFVKLLADMEDRGRVWRMRFDADGDPETVWAASNPSDPVELRAERVASLDR